MLTLKTKRRLVLLAGLVTLLVPAGFALQTVYVSAQSQLVQKLLRTSWQKTLVGSTQVRPWPGAAIWPVARLEVPRLGADVIISSARSRGGILGELRHVPGTPLPGTAGNSVIYGQFSLRFGFVHELRLGDELAVETVDRQRHRFRVVELGPTLPTPGLIAIRDAPAKLTLAVLDRVRAGAAHRYEYVVIAEYMNPPPARPRWRQMLAET